MRKLLINTRLPVPIGDLLRNILKPLPGLRPHPKDIQSLFKEPLTHPFPTDNKIELPLSTVPKSIEAIVHLNETQNEKEDLSLQAIEPQVVENLPVTIMVQSSNAHNKYTVTDDDELTDDDSQGKIDVDRKQPEAIEVPVTETTPTTDGNPTQNTSTDNYEPAIHQLLPIKESNIVPRSPPEISTMTVTSAPIETSTKKVRKEFQLTPSLDRIVEKVFERYQDHDEIPSYEDMWYDDNGEMLWSQEDYANAKNVKRQVEGNNNVVKPVPLTGRKNMAKEEMQRLHQLTDLIDRFRNMLDIAQQVDYYLTKRLQSGINALAAMYGDSPPQNLSANR